ncbi:MAG: cob(I)yrinic acid a,c-diamide adenosyltransferase [Salinivirgaceae bacterium]|jgi:cob(I)alamin adenosyltransferase|nr:cob(I)yrinic acid a,c-diamide adenosyltransferase [Salinivirgaceae bacterium]
MKVYTKTGDKGTTDLLGGKRVPKNHERIEAYGTIDELMAFTGLVYDQMEEECHKKVLLEIQDRLMTCATILASEFDNAEIKLPEIIADDILFLEKEIDSMQTVVPRLTEFILPGGHTTISFCHIARTVCRRAERLTISIKQQNTQSEMVIKYLNRLSDYFFVLARKLAIELKIEEINWIQRS